MNRGVLQNSPVQQMMSTGNMNCWNIINSSRSQPQHPPPFIPSSSSPLHQYPIPAASLPLGSENENQYLPESWSQLLMGGMVSEEDRCSFGDAVDVKQERSEGGYGYDDQYQGVRYPWGQVVQAASSPTSITGFSSNMLDFSGCKIEGRNSHQDYSSECNSSTANGPAFKKAKVQSSAQSTFKVRKEKLGDRITTLHQLVCPFGKTDTASVLLEAIGYIRFLQGQIEALSSPYLGNGPESIRQTDLQEEPKKDLRSKGLCLVPVSCTTHVGSDSGVDYWAPTLGGGFR